MDFGFAEVGVVCAQAADLFDQRRRPVGLSAGLGCAGAGNQGRRVVFSLAQGGFPAIPGSSADCKGIASRGEAVSVQEMEDFESVLGMGIHTRQIA